jgi:hypothetical protein
MNKLKIFLLCTAMLLIGWHSRGIIHGLAVTEETDRRLTRCLAWGLASGTITLNTAPQDDAATTNRPAGLSSGPE